MGLGGLRPPSTTVGGVVDLIIDENVYVIILEKRILVCKHMSDKAVK